MGKFILLELKVNFKYRFSEGVDCHAIILRLVSLSTKKNKKGDCTGICNILSVAGVIEDNTRTYITD